VKEGLRGSDRTLCQVDLPNSDDTLVQYALFSLEIEQPGCSFLDDGRMQSVGIE
jgi:hypothetical protein